MRALLVLVAFATFLTGCESPRTSPAAALPEHVAGRRLYVAKCAKCHKLYNPTDYSDHEWKGWFEKMGRKAKLRPVQQDLVAAYVEQTLRHPPP